jgi:hypothetical protein
MIGDTVATDLMHFMLPTSLRMLPRKTLVYSVLAKTTCYQEACIRFLSTRAPSPPSRNFSSSENDKASSSPPRKRKRHRFSVNTDDIPSFQDFQQHVKVRSLYRQFLRLTGPINSGQASAELRVQIRREFRATSSTADKWDIKRAMSEASRRYKDLSAMLQSVPSRKTTATTDETSTASLWPWQTDSQADHPPPRPFPSKLDK